MRFACKIKKSSLISSLLLGLVIFGCMIFLDEYYQYHSHQLFWSTTTNKGLFLMAGLAFPLSAFSKNRSILIVTAIMLAVLCIQLVHAAYFGIPVSPYDITLFFSDSIEILHIFSQLLSIAYVPILICAGAFAIIWLAIKNFPERLRLPYVWIIFVVILCIPIRSIIYTAHHDGRRRNVTHSDGQYPGAADNLWISSQKTLLYYFAVTLPHQFFIPNRFAQPLVPPLPLLVPHPNINIIIVMGESLTDKHMSSYGYSRPTTPYLDSIKNDPAVVFKQGISAGVSTEVSLSFFFNMLVQPDATLQLSSGHRNLFKMAQENGFETHFISAQAHSSLNVIKSYLFPKYIDHYGDSLVFGASFNQLVHDINLLNYVKTADFKQPTFMVLQQSGSHSPYSEHYPDHFNFFANGKTASFQQNQIDTYDNSVRYTDYVLEQIVETVRQKANRPTLLIFTSDHGESLGENGIYGHENVMMKDQHFVPMVFMAFHGANFDFLKKKSREDINSHYMSHYELSEAVARLLGYQPPGFSQQKYGYFVDGKALSGVAGFDQISLTKDGQLTDHLP